MLLVKALLVKSADLNSDFPSIIKSPGFVIFPLSTVITPENI